MKKRRSNNKVLVVAIVLALVIVIGATFAWYTSKDEVTNKLSATNDYNVSITETYTPETSWTPGEEVNKDVALVNTGSTAAFVRAYLSGQFVITSLDKAGDPANEVDEDVNVTLGTQDKNATEGQVTKTMREEAFKAEAGGYLVYAAAHDAENAVAALVNRNAAVDENTNGWIKFDALTYDYVADAGEQTVAEIIGADGYYIFARVQTVEDPNNNGNLIETYVYDGYYFDANVDGNVYYKISVDDLSKADPTDTDTLPTFNFANNGIDVTPFLYSKSSVVVDTDADTVKITNVAKNTAPNTDANREMIQVWYDPDKEFGTPTAPATVADTSDDIIVNIYLDQYYNNNWDKIVDQDTNDINTTYYYKHELIGGATTEKLIDAVELDDSVTNEAFCSFDYYLNVLADSIQAVEGDNKANTSVADGWDANSDADRTAYNLDAEGIADGNNTLVDGTAKSVDINWNR